MEHHSPSSHNQPKPRRNSDYGVDKRSAGLGFVGGILVLCTIGFFILLGVVLNQDDTTPVAAKAPSPTVVAPSGPPAPAAPADITIALEDGDHVRGDANAPVTIVEYSDFDCPFCSRHHPTVQQVLDDNPGKVKWVYRHFPLRSIHPNAARKAEASECVAKQGGDDAFWKFTDSVFLGTPSDTDDQMSSIAVTAGVDKAKFLECLNNGDAAGDVQADEASGLAAGAQGTPHSIILGPNGETVPLSGALPAAQIQSVIDTL